MLGRCNLRQRTTSRITPDLATLAPARKLGPWITFAQSGNDLYKPFKTASIFVVHTVKSLPVRTQHGRLPAVYEFD
jgi:hypothetical protein